MFYYAANTHGKRNLAAIKSAGFRILITPGRDGTPPPGYRYAIDNGQFSNYVTGKPFDGDRFRKLLESHGCAADFIVIPDKVADRNSMDFSKLWIPEMRHFKLILLALQDGMLAKDVGALVRNTPNMGLFLGGSSQWKLKTLYAWGMVAASLGCYYHVGRVNTARRIRLCAEAGAHSVDGSSPTRYSCTVPLLKRAISQPSLLTPAMTKG